MSLLSYVWFGRFGLVGLVWQVWFGSLLVFPARVVSKVAFDGDLGLD